MKKRLTYGVGFLLLAAFLFSIAVVVRYKLDEPKPEPTVETDWMSEADRLGSEIGAQAK